ncbi:MAG: GatB/YqeY domain-containing protein [Candidatus Nealsonbacteria bacterium]
MDTLKSKIENDFKNAFKQKKQIEVSVLRLLKADIINKEKERRYQLSKENPDFTNKELEEKSILTDEETLDIILSKSKKSEESITEFKKGNRDDLVKKEEQELEFLKKYMPQQITEQEIKKLAEEIIKETKAKSIKDMGKVMSELMPKVKGKASGSLISKIVKELLS